MKKILITGANGLLGQSLINKFIDIMGFEIIALSRGGNRNINRSNGYKYIDLDFLNLKELYNILNNESPDYIINSGAMTNVDLCEKEPENCYSINTKTLEIMSNYCKKNNSHLIQISTDFVFDGGKKTEYFENEITNPINIYGKSKDLAEKIILKSDINYSILRTSQIFGFIQNFKKENIITWIKKNLKNKKEITLVNDQYRMPTYVDDLVFACEKCINNSIIGIFNTVGKNYFSILEIGYLIADYYNLNKQFIQPIKTLDLNLLAKRPLRTKMSLKKTKNILNYNPKTISEILGSYRLN